MNGLAVCGILAGFLYFILFNWTCLYFILLALLGYFALSWLRFPSSANKYNGPRRKIIMSSWSDPSRPTVFGHFKIRVSSALDFIEKVSKKTGKNIKIAHLVIKAIGQSFNDFPEINTRLVFGNYKQNSSIDALYTVRTQTDNDLGHIRIQNVNKKSLGAISDDLIFNTESLTQYKTSQTYKSLTNVIEKTPTCVLSVFIGVASFIESCLGLDILKINGNNNQFGSYIVLNLEDYNTQIAYPTLIPTYRTPAAFTITTIRDEPIVENSRATVEKVLNLCISYDSRYADEALVLKIQNKIKNYLESPEKFLNLD
jgi:pyruvate/2-oxoglutarate dehydrogenase complex dihydrolipoamide acyltransferase (E2) component